MSAADGDPRSAYATGILFMLFEGLGMQPDDARANSFTIRVEHDTFAGTVRLTVEHLPDRGGFFVLHGGGEDHT
jgi:hypothetical protein